MAYFPNGTSGRMYQDKWCNNCLHWPQDPEDGGCDVWFAHLLHNYEGAARGVLDTLIPEKDGEPQECSMFLLRAAYQSLAGSDHALSGVVRDIAEDGSVGSPEARLAKIKQVCALVGRTARKQKETA